MLFWFNLVTTVSYLFSASSNTVSPAVCFTFHKMIDMEECFADEIHGPTMLKKYEIVVTIMVTFVTVQSASQ